MSLASKNLSINCSRLILLYSLCLFCYCAVAFAQGGVGSSRGLPGTSDGINTIKGHLYFPTEPQGGKRFKVRITSTDFLDQTTLSDEDGVFEFNRLPAGNFTIAVDGGKDFDSAVEPVSIYRETSAGSQNLNIIITLKPKGT